MTLTYNPVFITTPLQITNHNFTSWRTNSCAVVIHFHIISIIFNATIYQSAFLHSTVIVKRVTILIKDNLKTTSPEDAFWVHQCSDITLTPAQHTLGCANTTVTTVYRTLQLALTHISSIFSETLLRCLNIPSEEPHKLLISTQTCHLLNIKLYP